MYISLWFEIKKVPTYRSELSWLSSVTPAS